MPILKVYFYNVTNNVGFLEGDEKLRLNEMGPYVYREVVEKKNISWNRNGTVSYTIVKTFQFDANASAGLESDTVLLPNVPVLTALWQASHSPGGAMLPAIKQLMDELKLEPFSKKTVQQYLWGYDDPLITLSRQLLPPNKRPANLNFGYLVGKNITPSGVFTVSNGYEKHEEYAQILYFNGIDEQDKWSTDECNKIRGSDGLAFPPFLNENSSLYLYQPDFCRPLELIMKNPKERVTHENIETLRFQPAEHVFGSVDEFPENECYCSAKPCAPKGTFNVSLCQFGAPVFLSWPHFLNGDPSLLENVEGVEEPNPELHQFYVDLQPKLGVIMGVKARVQINVQMTKVPEIPQGANLTDGLVPVLWFEDGFDELPSDVVGVINQALTIPEVAVTVLSYLLLILGGLLCGGGVAYFIKASGLTDPRPTEADISCQFTNKHSSPIEMGEIVERDNASKTNNL